MNWIFYFILSITLGFFVSALPSTAGAQVYRLSSSYNVRSSPAFTSKASDPNNNIVGGLNPGTQIEVLETQTLKPSKKLAYRIRVLDGRYKNKTIWIRKSADEHFVPTEGAACSDCGEKALPLSQAADRNLSELKAIPKQFETEFESNKIGHDSLMAADDSLMQKIKNYSNSSAIAKMIKAGLGKGRTSIGRCYRQVKELLTKGRLAPSSFGSEPARLAKEDLKKYGFINLLETDPYSSQITKASEAPKGSILVYSSGIPCRRSTVKDCGHVEVKLGEPGEPGYASDYKSADAINETASSKRFGSRYKLIGVMVKPMDNE